MSIISKFSGQSENMDKWGGRNDIEDKIEGN